MDERPLSITDFLTDGSVAALCDALSALTTARISVRDPDGRRIIRCPDQSPPWKLEPQVPGDEAIARVIAIAFRDDKQVQAGSQQVFPLFVGEHPVGAIVIDAPAATPIGKPLHDSIRLLVSTISEVLESQDELRHRHSELRLLYRLSSLLVASRDLTTILEVTLRSAIDIFRMDAGSVHLLDDDGHHLVLRAHAGLPPAFTDAVKSLPVNLADPARPVSSTTLIEQGRDVIVQQMNATHLAGLISGGLAFNDKPLGVLRLYANEPALLEPTQHALLQTVAELVSAAVAGAKLIEAERTSRQMQRQVRLAADVQRRMLPRVLPNLPRLDIATRYIPSFDLGGDFYDLIDLKGNLGVLVGDVSGKGVPAALLMASVRASLRAHALGVYHLDDVMRRVNQGLVRDTLDNEFATIFYGVIDLKSLRFTYCNAGHDPPFIVRIPTDRAPTTADLAKLEAGGMAVGIDDSQKYDRGMWDLKPNEVFVAYTDGILDAMNFSGEKYGRKRFLDSLLSYLAIDPGASAKSIADHLVWDMRRFIGLNPETDDTTIVVIRVK